MKDREIFISLAQLNCLLVPEAHVSGMWPGAADVPGAEKVRPPRCHGPEGLTFGGWILFSSPIIPFPNDWP